MAYPVHRYSIPKIHFTMFYNFKWHIGQRSLLQIVGIFSIKWFFSKDLKSSLRSIFLISSGSSKSFQVAGRVNRGNLPTRLVQALVISNSFTFLKTWYNYCLSSLICQTLEKDLGKWLCLISEINCRRENFTRESKGKTVNCLNKGPVCALYFTSATHRIAFFCLIIILFKKFGQAEE